MASMTFPSSSKGKVPISPPNSETQLGQTRFSEPPPFSNPDEEETEGDTTVRSQPAPYKTFDAESRPPSPAINKYKGDQWWISNETDTQKEILFILKEMALCQGLMAERLEHVEQWILHNRDNGNICINRLAEVLDQNHHIYNTIIDQHTTTKDVVRAHGNIANPRGATGPSGSQGPSTQAGNLTTSQLGLPLGNSTGTRGLRGSMMRFAPPSTGRPTPQPSLLAAGRTEKSAASKPIEFNGERGAKARDFTYSCANYIADSHYATASDEKKIRLIISYLRGPAVDWICPFQDLHNAGVPQTIFTNLDVFQREWELAFGEIEQVEVYRQKYKALVQTKTVVEYITQFRILSAPLDYNEQTLKDNFYAGLKDNIKNMLTSQAYNHHNTTLQDLFTRLQEIDVALIARNMEKRGNSTSERATPSGTQKRVTTSATAHQFQKGEAIYTVTPQGSKKGTIESIGKNKKGFLTPKVKWADGTTTEIPFSFIKPDLRHSKVEVAAATSETVCYRCQKKGHMAKDCHTEIAALGEVDTSDSESGKESNRREHQAP